jgi:hypothetical protein
MDMNVSPRPTTLEVLLQVWVDRINEDIPVLVDIDTAFQVLASQQPE